MIDIITANADILCTAGTVAALGLLQQVWEAVRRNADAQPPATGRGNESPPTNQIT